MLVSFLILSACHSSALFASVIILVSCSPGGLHLVSLVLCLVQCWFFPATYLVPTRSCSFRPSSGSSVMSFHCSSFRSPLPFSSMFFFFVAALCLLFSVRCSLCPFIGRSSSLPSPPLSLPASGSFSGLWIVQIYSFPWCQGRSLGRVPSLSLCVFMSSPVVRLPLVCCFLFFILSSVSGIFSLPSSFCLGSFRLLCWWGSFPSSFLCFPYRSAFLYCLGLFAPTVLCHSSLSSTRCFFVSFLGSVFLPSRYIFPSPLSLSTWSLRVLCILLCLRPFPLDSSSALLSVLSSGLFHHWAFPFLTRSWFLVRLLVFSPLDDVGAFVYAYPGDPLFGVSPLPVRLVSFGRCPVLFLPLLLLSPLPVFWVFVRRLCPLSLRFLVLCVRSLATLSVFFRGYFCCVLSVLCVFLLLVLLLFLPVLFRFCFSILFLGPFLRELLVS